MVKAGQCKNYAAITVPYYHAIIAIPKAWTPGTNGPIKSEVVLVKADSVADLDKYKGKLAGKIVIFDTKNTLKRSDKPDLERYTDAQLAEMAAAKPQARGERRAFDPNSPQMAARRKMIAMRAAMSKFMVDEKLV